MLYLVAPATMTRTFGRDNVHLSEDHPPYLQRRFQGISLHQLRVKLPFIPALRDPYYRFVGRKAGG